MIYEIIVTVDVNDADYVSRVEKINDKQLDRIKPLIAAIKKFSDTNSTYFNWPENPNAANTTPRDMYNFPEEIIQEFECFIPYSEYGIVRVKSVTITPFIEKTQLLYNI